MFVRSGPRISHGPWRCGRRRTAPCRRRTARRPRHLQGATVVPALHRAFRNSAVPAECGAGRVSGGSARCSGSGYAGRPCIERRDVQRTDPFGQALKFRVGQRKRGHAGGCAAVDDIADLVQRAGSQPSAPGECGTTVRSRRILAVASRAALGKELLWVPPGGRRWALCDRRTQSCGHRELHWPLDSTGGLAAGPCSRLLVQKTTSPGPVDACESRSRTVMPNLSNPRGLAASLGEVSRQRGNVPFCDNSMYSRKSFFTSLPYSRLGRA